MAPVPDSPASTATRPAASVLPEVATATDRCQRWRDGQHAWRRPADGGFDRSRYTVAPVPESAAKRFVETQHYSRSYPAASRRYGLFDTAPDAPALVGVAVYGIPVQAKVLTAALPSLEPYRQSLELSRFVLLDDVPANGESWFLARCHRELLDVGVRGVVSFADPVARRAADGSIIAPGHCGTIYQASNAAYTGRGTARTLTVLPDGTVLNARAQSKVRRQEQGHEYVETRLIALGAPVPHPGQDMARWLAAALDAVHARRVRHRGNHRYVFRLGTTRRDREAVTLGLPTVPAYPKQPDA